MKRERIIARLRDLQRRAYESPARAEQHLPAGVDPAHRDAFLRHWFDIQLRSLAQDLDVLAEDIQQPRRFA